MPQTKVVFYKEDDRTVPTLDWLDGFDTLRYSTQGFADKRKRVPPSEIDRAIERRQKFLQNPKQHTQEIEL